jgi:opacity protein-like surface antigen
MKRILIIVTTLAFVFASPVFSATKVKGFQLSTSIGLGAGFPFGPDAFDEHWDPSFGAVLEIGAQRSLIEISTSFDYNFFLSNGVDPDDVNILSIFLNLKVKPISKSSVRPYLLVGGGYYRYWIVDADITENTTGYQAGAGVELDISKTQRMFIDVKQVIGRTRDTNPESANTNHIPARIGLIFLF